MNGFKITLAGLLVFSFTTIFTTGCKKYEDGPGISLRSKTTRLARAWEVESYLRNDNDETTSILIKDYLDTYSDDGTYSRSYIDKDGDEFSEVGAWEFESNNEQVHITGVSSIEWSDETSTISSSDYIILRLTATEFWYYFENGGDRHEIHLKAK